MYVCIYLSKTIIKLEGTMENSFITLEGKGPFPIPQISETTKD